MLIGPDETARIKVLVAGDEEALEERVNSFLAERPDQALANLSVQQVTYHSRMGATEFGLMAVLVMRIKR